MLTPQIYHQPAVPSGTEDLYLALKLYTFVIIACGRCDRLIYNRQVIEAFLHEKPDDAVAVEDKVTTLRRLITNDGQKGDELMRLTQYGDIGVVHQLRDCCDRRHGPELQSGSK